MGLSSMKVFGMDTNSHTYFFTFIHLHLNISKIENMNEINSLDTQ